MGLLAWVVMGLAIWHFTIWLPDRYWGGIVGAFVGSVVGAALFGLIIHGFSIPGTHDTHIVTALEGIPGALIGIGLVYAEGVRRERVACAPPGAPPPRAGGRAPPRHSLTLSARAPRARAVRLGARLGCPAWRSVRLSRTTPSGPRRPVTEALATPRPP